MSNKLRKNLSQSSQRHKEQRVITYFIFTNMLFFIFIMKIKTEVVSGLLITYNSSCLCVLCEIKFQRIRFKLIMYEDGL